MKMLLVIIAIFLICWGPKLVLAILKRHDLSVLQLDAAFYIAVSENNVLRAQICS